MHSTTVGGEQTNKPNPLAPNITYTHHTV